MINRTDDDISKCGAWVPLFPFGAIAAAAAVVCKEHEKIFKKPTCFSMHLQMYYMPSAFQAL